jgi:hypothetical protein
LIIYLIIFNFTLRTEGTSDLFLFLAGSDSISEGGTIGFGVYVGVSAIEEGDVGTCDRGYSIILC